MNKVLKYILVLCTAIVVVCEGHAQVEDDDLMPRTSSVREINITTLCKVYNVDSRLYEPSKFETIIDSISKVQPNAYPLISQWCMQQRRACQRMKNSLISDYTFAGDTLWMDQNNFAVGIASFLRTTDSIATKLGEQSTFYDNKEIERIENERRQQEEQARREAQRILREKNQRMSTLQDSIKTLHQQIRTLCDNTNISDKNRIKELKDIFYAYLAIYNKYDISSDNISDDHFAQLDELKAFQDNIIDNLLGNNSYHNQIEQFQEQLKVKAGKNHTDVLKSYTKVFKKIQIPVSFRTIAEYQTYINNLQTIRSVQESYIQAIDLRATIQLKTDTLQQICGKRNRDLFNAYKEILAELNQLPAYNTTQEADKFIFN